VRRENRGTGNGVALAALGFLGGLAVGALLWSRHQHRHRQDLFSRHSLRRLAALGYLRGHPSADTARLLRDYIQWEPRSVLRKRGQQLLRQMEAQLY
jgi:hypothetical protein